MVAPMLLSFALFQQDTGAYGRDIGVTLPQLLWQIVEALPEGVMLRLGMTNPPYILEHLEVRTAAGGSQIPSCYQSGSLISTALSSFPRTGNVKNIAASAGVQLPACAGAVRLG